jgi:DNA-binding response OmpR family regulator
MKSVARILVVDNDQAILECLQLALTQEGYEVAATLDNSKALQYLITFRPSVIILDLLVPNTDGKSVLATYRRMCHQHIPIIGLSTAPHFSDIAETLDIEDHLPKPFDLNKLLDRVEYYVSHPSHRD